MPRWAIRVALCTSLLGIPCLAQQTAKQRASETSRAEAKAYVRHTKDGDVFVTENASFDFVGLLQENGKNYTYLRLLQTDHNEWSDGRMGVHGTVTVTAWPAGSGSGSKPVWTFYARGSVGRPLQGLKMFRISNSPCCSEPFKNLYFSLLSGKRLYETNGTIASAFRDDPALLTIIGGYDGSRYSQSRYVGFGSVSDIVDEPPSIQYGTDTAIMQRFSLLGHEYGDTFDVPTISIIGDGHKSVKQLEVAGTFDFTLLLQFPDGPEVRIPVIDDVLRADKAALPAGYSLRQERAEPIR